MKKAMKFNLGCVESSLQVFVKGRFELNAAVI